MTSPERTTLIERFLFMLALPLFLMMAHPYTVLNAYIALGQAHFLLTYLEQWKNGAYTEKGFILYAAAFIVALVCVSVSRDGFIFFVAAFFLLHSFFDDLRLMKARPGREAVLHAAPHLSLALAVSSDALIHTGLSPYVFPASVIGYAATLLYALVRRRCAPYILYCLCITPVVFLIYRCSMQGALAAEGAAIRIFGLIILSHYFNWYAYIYHKFAALSPQSVRPYLWRAAAVNVITVGGWFLGSRGLHLGGYDFIYRAVYYPSAFYLWTLMHLLVTMRKSGYSLKRRAAA